MFELAAFLLLGWNPVLPGSSSGESSERLSGRYASLMMIESTFFTAASCRDGSS